MSATWDAEPQTPRRARDLLTTFLSCQHLDDLIPTAALLVSELVTNAVVYAGTPITLRANWARGRLRVEVGDPNPTLGGLRPPDRTGGNGLHLVDCLATNWASEPFHNDGKVTWFELRRT